MGNKGSLWNRFVSLFKAKAHKALDDAETTTTKVSSVKQKIRELEDTHRTAVIGVQKIKVVALKYWGGVEKANTSADSYAETAKKLKAKYEIAKGKEKTQLKSDIVLMLIKNKDALTEVKSQTKLAINQDAKVDAMYVKIKQLAKLIKDTKVNIVNVETQSATAKINKDVSFELSELNFDSLTNQLKDLEDGVGADNMEAEAWSGLDDDLMSDEKRIEKLLEDEKTSDGDLFDSFMTK